MKNVMLICSLFLVFVANAQRQGGMDKKNSQERVMKDATPEEMATLRSKKLTLDFDLSQAQQSQVKAIELGRAKTAKARMAARKDKNTLTKAEVVTLKNDRLDAAIAYKREMKAVLNTTQYERWEKRMRSKGRKMRSKGKKGKKKEKMRH